MLRAFGFAAASLVAYAGALLGLLAGPVAPRAGVAWQGICFQFWSRALCRILGVRVRSVGPPPRRPFFLVANHLSYLDIIALGTRLPCVFVAKGEIDRWPVMGALCRSVNTVFIDRTLKRDIPRALAKVHDLLARGQGIVIFPESTSSSGAGVIPFRSPLLELAVRLELAVHWAAITYSTPGDEPPAYLRVCWWGNMHFGPHVRELLLLDRIDATLVFGAEPVLEPDRKRLTARLYEAVAGAFVPVPQGSEPLSPADAPVPLAADSGPPFEAAAGSPPPFRRPVSQG